MDGLTQFGERCVWELQGWLLRVWKQGTLLGSSSRVPKNVQIYFIS